MNKFTVNKVQFGLTIQQRWKGEDLQQENNLKIYTAQYKLIDPGTYLTDLPFNTYLIEPGHKLYHPVSWGINIATTVRAIEYAEDQNGYGPLSNEPNTFVRINCAFAELDLEFKTANMEPSMIGVGTINPLIQNV